jgi:V/A-type H+-transporting ATPase subunit E
VAAAGVNNIIKAIEHSAENKVSEILSEAREKVDAKLNEARKKADENARSILSRGEQEARMESQRIHAEARIKARREIIISREDLVRKAFDMGREILIRIARDRRAEGIDYDVVLKNLINESVMSSGSESVEVFLNRNDTALVSKDFLKSISQELGMELGEKIDLRIAEDPLSCSGGVIIRSIDGKVSIDNTFESRIDRFKELMRIRVAKELFGQEM